VRTHFEAWCKAWRDIGRAHAFGLHATSAAILRVHRDVLIYGSGFLRLTASGVERLDPCEVIFDQVLPSPAAAPVSPWWKP
jgi:hypothetical protein